MLLTAKLQQFKQFVKSFT